MGGLKVIKQMVRGCGNLPHVGSHPGWGFLLLMVLAGAVVGIDKGGLRGAIGGALFMALFLVPLFLWGAYQRAEDCDRMSKDGGA